MSHWVSLCPIGCYFLCPIRCYFLCPIGCHYVPLGVTFCVPLGITPLGHWPTVKPAEREQHYLAYCSLTMLECTVNPFSPVPVSPWCICAEHRPHIELVQILLKALKNASTVGRLPSLLQCTCYQHFKQLKKYLKLNITAI